MKIIFLFFISDFMKSRKRPLSALTSLTKSFDLPGNSNCNNNMESGQPPNKIIRRIDHLS